MSQPSTPVRYQGSHLNITTSSRGRIRSAIRGQGRVQGRPSPPLEQARRIRPSAVPAI